MSPISVLPIVLLWYCCRKRCQGKLISQKYARTNILQNTTITELSLYSNSEYKSTLECSALCSEDEECVSFFYNTRSGQCTGHTVQFYSTEPGSPDEGSVFFTRPVDKRDCAEILELYPDSPDGLYIINPLDGKGHFQVFCDMTTDGGGWTVFQRRQDGSEDFLRNWKDYKHGFGTLTREFWLGNDNIHRLTTSQAVQLRIDLKDHADQSRYAKFSSFQVEDEAHNYRFTESGYSGSAGNGLATENGMEFSTKERDNDKSDYNCAVRYTGAWWYKACHNANLNGKYGDNRMGKGVTWLKWHGHSYSLKWTEMKVKPI